jgi:hypothetical protein
MAAEPLPEVASRTLKILSTGAIDPGDQYLRVGAEESICFENTTNFPVDIRFTGGVFANINGLAPMSTSPYLGGRSPLKVATNYRIYNANTGQETGGPYVVEFGNGALTIQISGSIPDPNYAVIPRGGKIAFDDLDASDYKINWTSNGHAIHAWNPDPPKVSHGHNGDQTALPAADGKLLKYYLEPALSPNVEQISIAAAEVTADGFSAEQLSVTATSAAAGGGGTVKVGS